MPSTETRPLTLQDSSGGLNNNVLPANLKPNELSQLENRYTDEGGFPGRKVPGAEVIQYAPIDPRTYEVDANSLAHYALDEVGNPLATVIDNSGNARNLFFVESHHAAPSAAALFPIGAGLGRSAVIQDDVINSNGTGMRFPYPTGPGSSPYDGLSKITVRGWAIIPSTFSGRPINLKRLGNAVAAFSNSGAILFGSGLVDPIGGNNLGAICNGFTLHRNWDAASGKDASDPFVRFTLRTRGVSGTVTVLESRYLPTNTLLEFKFTYDSVTGIAELYVLGSLHARSFINGAGTVDDSLGYGWGCLGSEAQVTGVFGIVQKTCAGVVLDEWEIANVIRAGFRFKKPKSRPRAYGKSDGTRQLMAAAEDGLYFTVGDGNWTKIKDGLDPLAKWDMLQIGDFFYMANGTDGPISWNGIRAVPWGEAQAALTMNNSGMGASPPAGAYIYGVSYEYGAEETGIFLSQAFNSNGTNISITDILTRFQNCSAVWIWRTKAGGSTLYRLRRIVNNPDVLTLEMTGPYVAGGSPGPETDTGSDGVADATLGTGEYKQATAEILSTALGNPQYLLENVGRVHMAGFRDEPYTEGWTEPGLPDIRLPFSAVNVSSSWPISALSKVTGETHLHLSGHGCAVLRGNKPSSWTLAENLHPSIGATDHFGIVYRTIPREDGGESDKTMVVFPSLDGFYGYVGYEFFRIDERISATFNSLTASKAAKLQFITSTQAQWESANNAGGASTANIDADTYSPDGLTQVPGNCGIVDQLEEIGLWHATENFLPPGVVGKVISICKGTDEGEFYFATNANAQTVWRTTDNFQTAAALAAVGGAGEFAIELVYATFGGFNNLFVFMSDINEKGSIYWIQDPVGAGGVGPAISILAAGPFYWYADTGLTYGSYASGLPGFLNSIAAEGAGENNVYLSHAQRVFLSRNNTSNVVSMREAASLTANSGPIFQAMPAGADAYYNSHAAGFVAFFESPSGVPGSGFRVTLTHRETGMWKGGSFRPQAFYDATTGKLFFAGSTAPDATGNVQTFVYSIVVATSTLAQLSAAKNTNIALIPGEAGFAYYVDSSPDATTLRGFTPGLKKITLASGAIASVGNLTLNFLALRLSYNAQSAKLLVSGKSYDVSIENIYQFSGFLASLTTLGVFTKLKGFTVNEAAGAFPTELVYQTTTPYAFYAVMQNLQMGELASVYKIGKDMAAPVSPSLVSADVTVYKATGYDEATDGIRSNAIFVAASGAPNYLWADRLYWSVLRDDDVDIDDAKPLQLGVPGTWKVIGVFIGALQEFGVFNAFGDLETRYSGNVQFQVANGSTGAPFADSDFVSVAPNKKITIAGTAPGTFVQWRLTLTWDYSVAAPTSFPYVEFVTVNYFLGTTEIPTIVGIHHAGRTRWSVSENGEVDNNLEIVYQKNNTWTTCPGRRISGYEIFRGDLVAFEDYTLIRMEKGTKWLGNLIRTLAVTGYIMNEPLDKYIRDLQASLLEYVNADFPTKSGWIKVVPVAAGVDLEEGAWYLPVPATAGEPFPRQVQGQMQPNSFIQAWARAMAIKIMTSDDEENFIPDVGQTEDIQALMLKFRVSPPRHAMPVA